MGLVGARLLFSLDDLGEEVVEAGGGRCAREIP
jgi:hypothetical protein